MSSSIIRSPEVEIVSANFVVPKLNKVLLVSLLLQRLTYGDSCPDIFAKRLLWSPFAVYFLKNSCIILFSGVISYSFLVALLGASIYGSSQF